MTFTIDGRCPTNGSANSFIDPRTPENDHTRVLSYLEPLLRGYDSGRMVSFVHDGAPASKSRARWSKKTGRFYTPAESQNAQTALSWRFREFVKETPWQGNIAIAVVFFRPNRKRIDVDNLMKLVLDAGTKAGVWGDDCQVTHQIAVVEQDADRPRTVIALSPVESSLNRNNTVEMVCIACKKPFLWTRTKGTPAKYCSNQCRIRLGNTKCPVCGVEFKMRVSTSKYCSRPCRNAVTLLKGRKRMAN